MSRVTVGKGHRAWTICYSDERLMTPNPDCPNAAEHTPRPSGYGAHSDWAEAMALTHDQSQCPVCGLWMIWTRRGDA